MRRMHIILTMFFFSSCLLAHAQRSEKVIQKGNEFYKKQEYAEAQKEFSKIDENDSLNQIAQYNLANTFYRLGKKDDAIKTFDLLSARSNDSSFLSGLSYNEGVVFSNEKKLEESIAAYEKSLLLNPNDQQARENLQKALLELKKKNTPPENKPQQQPPKINPRDAAQKLKQLEQKEKQVQQRVQKEKSASAGSRAKDW
ncbi:MAG TPA: tetratricopeptide repeat protein [Chitinophagaceae bacterium]|nr:tetratricopeptide repeat protein [Chitinophagaceae bacterium]